MTTTQQVVAPEKCVRPVGDPSAKLVATPQTRALPHASALNLKPCGLSNLTRFVARQVRGPSLRDRGEQERSAAQQTCTHAPAKRPRVRADPRSATIAPYDGAQNMPRRVPLSIYSTGQRGRSVCSLHGPRPRAAVASRFRGAWHGADSKPRRLSPDGARICRGSPLRIDSTPFCSGQRLEAGGRQGREVRPGLHTNTHQQ
jgi:hypothetical protein